MIPDVPFDEYQFCVFQRWRTGEITFNVLSLVYGTSFPSLSIHTTTANPFFIKDTSAFLIVVYSAKYRGLMRAHGMPSLLDNIVQGATAYFLVIFTGHLLWIFFELLAPVSDRPADLYSSTHDELHIGTDSTPSCEVSRRLECRNKDEFDEAVSNM